MTYVYIKSEPELWTVGYYDPQGRWNPESDHGSLSEAVARTAYLNGENTSADARLKMHYLGLANLLGTVASSVEDTELRDMIEVALHVVTEIIPTTQVVKVGRGFYLSVKP